MADSFEAQDNLKTRASSAENEHFRSGRTKRVFVQGHWWRRMAERFSTRLRVSLHQSAVYGRPNMRFFAIMEVFGQPIYYVLWGYAYPQAYENAWMRVACILIALPMLFERRIGRWPTLNRWLPVYWLVCLLFELPFFFLFMLLMNDISSIWTLSGLAALMILVIIVFDWLMTVLLVTLGSALAGAVFLAIGGHVSANSDIPLPIVVAVYIFGLVAGSGMNYKAELVAREKMAAITDAVGTAAHELRTPLLGIRSGARGLSTYLPVLISTYEMARDSGLTVPPIRRAHFRQIAPVLDRIQSESEYAGTVLDMLLVNSNRASLDSDSFDVYRMSECIDAAIDRFPFHSNTQRKWVRWSVENDFKFLGSHLLMVHVLFNLIKNAIYHLESVERDEIHIWMTQDVRRGVNELHFLDTGPGIPASQLPRIFERFYSAMPRGLGTGIGLAFVQMVIHGFRGQIRCDSVVGEYTEFVMTFPESHPVNE